MEACVQVGVQKKLKVLALNQDWTALDYLLFFFDGSMHIHTHPCARIHIHAHVHTHPHPHPHMCMYTYAHIYTCINKHIYYIYRE